MKRIVLATVNARQELYSSTADEFSAVAPNVPMGLLAAYACSRGIDAMTVEGEVEGLSHDGLIDAVLKEDPLFLVVVCSGVNPSASTMVMGGIIDFFARFHARGIKLRTCVWGAHPTVLTELTLRETGADFVIRGEGYQTIVDLAAILSNESGACLDNIPGIGYLKDGAYYQTQDAALVEDLDALPMVDWDRMDPHRYRAHNWHAFGGMDQRSPYAIVWTSFGCPFQCNFCAVNNLFGKRVQRLRSIDSVMREIDILVRRHGVRHIKIMDELFVANARRVEEFCDCLDARGYDLNMWAYARVDTINQRLLQRLKKVGMNWISYGFESATDAVLRAADKGIDNARVEEVVRMTRDAGIFICADVMFGLWEEDMAALERTYDFLVKHNFEWANMYPVFGLPGTKLFEQVKPPYNWKTYSLYGHECCPLPTKHLSSAQVLRFRDDAFVRYYSRPEYLRMIEARFGVDTRLHVERMVSMSLQRRIIMAKEA